VTSVAPGAHGGDGAAVAAAFGLPVGAVLDLSMSLNPVAPDPVPVLTRHLDAVRRYPDPAKATSALAAVMGVDEGRLLLTNGGAEAIALVAGAVGGHVQEPEFSLHPRRGTPLWRSNPHNPSGRLALPDERADVWDEAFFPLATGRWTRGDDAVVVGSLTKLLSCPGLRIGYVLVPQSRIDLLEGCGRLQPAWAVNALALSALPELLAGVDLTTWTAEVKALRTRLVDVLARYDLEAQPSDANWVLVEAPGLRDRLMAHGVVVRDCANFAMPGVVRIAVPPAHGLDRLDAALGACRRRPFDNAPARLIAQRRNVKEE
jgi:histidinol-phosphate/aromatic aminotransferase/cobyric acid decarboxylase-like protein